MGKPPAPYFRRLTSIIHPQLPLTSRDSQRLLQLLNTEFRKQLDLKHPPPQAPLQQSPSNPWRPQSTKPTGDIAQPSPFHSASNHLGSILSNPLFAFSRNNLSELREAIGRKKKIDPVVWFVSKIAAGGADLDVARRCLQFVLEEAKRYKVLDSKTVLFERQAGWQVLDWMRSSGQEVLSHWKKDRSFCMMLARCLVVEGHGDDVLSWLRQSLSPEDTLGSPSIWHRSLALGYVAAHYYYDGGLNAAILAFVDCAAARAHSVARPAYRTDSSRIFELESIGSRIMQTIIRNENRVSVSPQNYDTFIGTLASWTDQVPRLTALLDIYHPVRPSAGALLKLLDQQQLTLNRGDAVTTTSSEASGTMPFGACLDAAELCFSDQEFEHGSRILAYVKHSLSQVPAPKDQESSQFDLEDDARLYHGDGGCLSFV